MKLTTVLFFALTFSLSSKAGQKCSYDSFNKEELLETTLIKKVDTYLQKDRWFTWKESNPTDRQIYRHSLRKLRDTFFKELKEENKDLIFEPKFTTKTSGMGLGLPMIKKIIETYDGTIGFSSTEGIGTVFTVILPRT